ncbi:hypothetical protein PHISCL_04328 [Aspergillus sclerotialis]|uniref:Uncharacterized protein n=1 Tax=Aspergillus sclerotialis TaxID=2070753 RepID=A0A3A2ZJM3_9EURO|nr:hypothetical protein PHISCL_04328 [Aspergillus sclerotialis]
MTVMAASGKKTVNGVRLIRDSSIPHQPVLDGADPSSQYTRISLEAVQLMRDSTQSPPDADPGKEGSDDLTRPGFDAYLDQLQRAQSKQEELEERLCVSCCINRFLCAYLHELN